MYSSKILDTPTTFGTSGLLYRSNKLMYDRETESLWNQLTGEPVIGPLSNKGIKLKFFPVLVTTWERWLHSHPETTVLSINTGIYPPELYRPESDPLSSYYDYRNLKTPLFPIWNIDPAFSAKDLILGLEMSGFTKAYPVKMLTKNSVLNDTVGNTNLAIVTSGQPEEIRVYDRKEHVFTLPSLGVDDPISTLVDQNGEIWSITETRLIHQLNPQNILPRIATHLSFWMAWSSFYPETEIYDPS